MLAGCNDYRLYCTVWLSYAIIHFSREPWPPCRQTQPVSSFEFALIPHRTSNRTDMVRKSTRLNCEPTIECGITPVSTTKGTLEFGPSNLLPSTQLAGRLDTKMSEMNDIKALNEHRLAPSRRLHATIVRPTLHIGPFVNESTSLAF